MADKEPGHNTCCSEHTTGIMTKTLAEHNRYGINEGDTRSIPSFFLLFVISRKSETLTINRFLLHLLYHHSIGKKKKRT